MEIQRYRTWSNFVRFKPAAFRMDAKRMIASPIMNATTGLSWWGGWGVVSPPSCLLRRSVASEANRLVDIRKIREGRWMRVREHK